MTLTLLAAATVTLTIAAGAQAPRASAPTGARTGMIVGQVVDPATGTPVSEAMVRLVMPAFPEELDTTPKGRVLADNEGRFFFTELPPGDYVLEATKDGYARGAYGQRRPWGQSQPVTLGEGERRSDLELPVWRYAVIGGTVVDEAGEPVVGIAVRALPREGYAGRTRFGNRQVIPELVPSTTTDDRGMFRLSRLSPGTYVVVVPSTHTTLPATALANTNTTVRNELFRAGVSEISLLGQPRTTQMGEFALMTPNRVLIPPPPTPAGRMQVYQTTWYPAAQTPGAATPITLKGGEERTDLTISMRPVPAVRISGRLVTPDGSAPPPMGLRLAGDALTDVITSAGSNAENVGFEAATGLSDGSGRFVLLGVPAGSYVLKQANPFLIATARAGQAAYWLSHQLSVGADDLEGLMVDLRPALRLEGRIELRPTGGGPPSTPLRLAGILFETPFGEPGQVAAEVDRETMTFATVAPGGWFIPRPYESGGWFVQSVTLDGKDVTDRAFDLHADATSFVVTYTDRPTKVAGIVTDAQGAASPTSVVLVFPADPQRWSGYGGSPRTFRTAQTTRTGEYAFPHLPPGDYYVVAVDAGSAEGWQDPARLEALAAQATRLSIASGDSLKTLALRVRAIQ